MSEDNWTHQAFYMAETNTEDVTTSDSDSFFSCNATLPEDSFLSLDVSNFNDSLSGEAISFDSLNSINENEPNLGSNFDSEKNFQAGLSSLYEIVNSHRWNVGSPQNVTFCASYIVKTLKTYGGGIPKDGKVINKESHLMFRTLDVLHDLLTKMKASSWHIDAFPDTTLCWNCEGRESLFKPVSPQNFNLTDRFCMVCMMLVPKKGFSEHGNSDAHLKHRKCLIELAYPFSCSKCEMRYSRMQDVQNHISSHCNVNNTSGDQKFKPLICFLCQVSFKSRSDLQKHHYSREHGFRLGIAKEFAMRRNTISEENREESKISGENCEDILNSFPKSTRNDAVGEEHTRKQNLTVPGDKGIARHSTPNPESNFSHRLSIPSLIRMEHLESDALIARECADQRKEAKEKKHEGTVGQVQPSNTYYCTSCSVTVPKANRNEHEKGKNHLRLTAGLEAMVSSTLVHSNNLKDSSTVAPQKAVSVDSGKHTMSTGSLLHLHTIHHKPLEKNTLIQHQCADLGKEVSGNKSEAKQHVGTVKEVKPSNSYYCTSCSVTVPTSNRRVHENGKNHLRHRSLEAIGQSSLVQSSNLKDSSTLTPKQAVIVDSNKHTKNAGSPLHVQSIQDKSETKLSSGAGIIKVIKNETNTVLIGNSVSVSLKEEYDQVCADENVEDFELECEICGVAFPIFNEDIELSVDMHVQNDPVHSLALAVPVERNVQCVAEMARVAMSVPPKVKLQKFSRTDVSIVEDKNIVVSEVLLLEQKCLSSQNKFRCELCNVTYKSENDIFYHVLSHKHLSDEWLEQMTHKELQERSRKLYSLLKHKYAVNHIYSAINWIKKKKVKNLNNAGESKSETHKVSNSNTIVAQVNSKTATTSSSVDVKCVVCSKNLAQMSKSARRNHRLKCKGKGSSLSGDELFCEMCAEDISCMVKEGRQQHRQSCSAKNLTFQTAHSSTSNVGASTSNAGASTTIDCASCLKDLSCLSKTGRQKHRKACAVVPPILPRKIFVEQFDPTAHSSTSNVGASTSSAGTSTTIDCASCFKDLSCLSKTGRKNHRKACAVVPPILPRKIFVEQFDPTAHSSTSILGASTSNVGASTRNIGASASIVGASTSSAETSTTIDCASCFKDLSCLSKTGRKKHRKACAVVPPILPRKIFVEQFDPTAHSSTSILGASTSNVGASTSNIGASTSSAGTSTTIDCGSCFKDLSSLTETGRKEHRGLCCVSSNCPKENLPRTI